MANPIIRQLFTADPALMVHNNTVYLYTGHDEAPAGTNKYIMNEWLCFSSQDMVHWQEQPCRMKATDFSWAQGDAYASCIVQHNDKFYRYMAVTPAALPGKAIGVAVSDDPAGPFRDARGTALISVEHISAYPGSDNFDPSVIVNDNGQAYIFWGKHQCFYARLKNNMTELDGPVKTVSLPSFEEGIHIHQRNGWYYLSYGYEFPEKVAYAMSRNIEGPWQFQGILNELAGNCETNRPGIIDFKGRTYFFYHNGGLPDGGSQQRSVCADYLYYNPDGTMKRVIMTSEGVAMLSPEAPPH